MEEQECTGYDGPIRDKNRYETDYSIYCETMYWDTLRWGNMKFDNHPMVELEMAGKICEGMRLREQMTEGIDWDRLTLNGFLYCYDASTKAMDVYLEDLGYNLQKCYYIDDEDADVEDDSENIDSGDRKMSVSGNTWCFEFLRQNRLLMDMVDDVANYHQGVIDVFQNFIDRFQDILFENYEEMKKMVDWKRMMNEQYRHYYVTEGRGKIQELNLKLQMMDEGERMEWAKGKKMELVERIGKTRLGEVHNRCCDIYGRNWDGERFVEEYKGLEDWDFGEILNYMVDITEWRFLNCVLEGRAFVDEENFVVEKNGETTVGVEDKVAEKGDVAVEKNGETAEKEGDSETEENGETVEEELGRIFGELMMNLEGYMKRPYRAKGVAEVVKRVLKRGNETELGGELVELLQARKREHHIGRMSVNHFFRLIKLLKENGMVDGCGKPVSEMVKDGLGRYWVSEFDKAFNKCFSTSWDKFRGQRYPHIGLNLIDELKRGR